MNEKKFRKLMKHADALISKCHSMGMKGLRERKTLRTGVTSLEIRWADTTQRTVERAIASYDRERKDREVRKAQGSEARILDNVGRVILFAYRILFNSEVLENGEMRELDNFIKALKKDKRITSQSKKWIKTQLNSVLDDMEHDHEKIRAQINAVLTKAQGGSAITTSLLNALHTHGHSVIRRRQIWIEFKTAEKERQKAQKEESTVLKDVNAKKLETDAKILANHLEKSDKLFKKARDLVLLEWEEVVKDLQEQKAITEVAAKEHELPKLDATQWDLLSKKIVEGLTKTFLHSLQTENNQYEDYLKKTRANLKSI